MYRETSITERINKIEYEEFIRCCIYGKENIFFSRERKLPFKN